MYFLQIYQRKPAIMQMIPLQNQFPAYGNQYSAQTMMVTPGSMVYPGDAHQNCGCQHKQKCSCKKDKKKKKKKNEKKKKKSHSEPDSDNESEYYYVRRPGQRSELNCL